MLILYTLKVVMADYSQTLDCEHSYNTTKKFLLTLKVRNVIFKYGMLKHYIIYYCIGPKILSFAQSVF